jgi:hypothetical protein
MALRPHIRAHEDVARVKEPGIGGGICHFLSPFQVLHGGANGADRRFLE